MKKTKKGMTYQRKAQIQKWVLLLPGTILYGVFYFIPLIGLFVMSLMDWKGIGPLKYVGFDNFNKILFNEYFRSAFINALINNIIFFLVIIASMVLLGTLLALLLSFKTRGKKVYKLIYFLPYPLAGAAVAFLMELTFQQQGPINSILMSSGIASDPIPFLGDKDLSLYMLAGFYSWHRLGFAIILILSAIVSVRIDLIEAAFIDGASRLQAIKSVILPVIMPAIVVIFVIIMVDTFNNADYTLLIFGPTGGVGKSADVLGSYLYRAAFGAGPSDPVLGYGIASVVGILTALIILPAALYGAMRNNKD